MPLEVAAHQYVAYLAQKMAEDAWEQLMLDNATYARVRGHDYHDKRRAFLRTTAPTLRQKAREVLGGMLARNDVSEQDKWEIWEALTLDRTLPAGGNSYRVN